MIRQGLPIFLMSPPRDDWTLRGKANFRAREAGATDPRRARAEWAKLADAIVQAGGEVIVCPPDPEQNLTGMIYTAEAGEFYRTEQDEPAYLLPNMAAEHRRLEADWVGRFVRETLGFETTHIESTWEAQGDAIRADRPDAIVHTYGVGRDARTEKGAYAEVAELLSSRHVHIRFHADPWFHGNTFLNVYRPAEQGAQALMVVCPEALPEDEYERLRAFVSGAKVHAISREQSVGYDTNALQVGSTILGPTSLSQPTDTALCESGFQVRKLDLSELFLKGGGAPVCLTNRMWGLRLDEVPDDVRWSKRPDIEAHELG